MDESSSLLSGNKAKLIVDQKLSVLQTIFAIVAGNIGGGILGLPFAFYRMGITLAVITTLLISVLSCISSMMLLKIKDLTPRRYESLYEIAFLLLGRQSIFYVSVITIIMMYGFLIMYYTLMGDIITSFFKEILIESNANKTAE